MTKQLLGLRDYSIDFMEWRHCGVADGCAEPPARRTVVEVNRNAASFRNFRRRYIIMVLIKIFL